jgi:hypothetical protein
VTPKERREVSLQLLAAANRASTARERHDWAEHRKWQAECDKWRLLLREDLLAEPGPQGDAAP